MPKDCNALTNIVCAVAVHFRTRTVRIRFATNLFQLAGKVVELGLYIGETVNTADDHSGVFAQTVQDAAERVLTNLVRHLSDLDSALSSSERLVAC